MAGRCTNIFVRIERNDQIVTKLYNVPLRVQVCDSEPVVILFLTLYFVTAKAQ